MELKGEEGSGVERIRWLWGTSLGARLGARLGVLTVTIILAMTWLIIRVKNRE